MTRKANPKPKTKSTLGQPRRLVNWVIKNPWSLAVSVVATILVILGGLNDIVDFIKRWPTDHDLIVLSALGLIYMVVFVITAYIALYRRENLPQRLLRAAKATLFILALLPLGVWWYAVQQNQLLDSKLVVLVAEFDGPSPESYHVTDSVLLQLRQSLGTYDDIVIRPLDEVIAEADGSAKAQELGKRYQADLIIWGWYGATSTDVLVTTHVENLANTDYLDLPTSGTYQSKAAVAQLNNFAVQQKLSNEMTAITLLVGGTIRYQSKDYAEAIHRFSAALGLKDWPDALSSRSTLFLLRGNSFIHSEKMVEASADYTEAIAIDPVLTPAYINRGTAYFYLGQLQQAVGDYTHAIQLDPSFADSYSNRGAAQHNLHDLSAALSDYTLAITLDPKSSYALAGRGSVYDDMQDYESSLEDYANALSISPNFIEVFMNRGVTYFKLKDYQHSLADLDQAIMLITRELAVITTANANSPAPLQFSDNSVARGLRLMTYAVSCFVNRASANSSMGQSQQAILDYNEAIETAREMSNFRDMSALISAAYVNRGSEYVRSGEVQRGIADFSEAIQANPSLAEAYDARGRAYLLLGKTQDAIADLRKVVAISEDSDLRTRAQEQLDQLGATP